MSLSLHVYLAQLFEVHLPACRRLQVEAQALTRGYPASSGISAAVRMKNHNPACLCAGGCRWRHRR